MFEVLKAFQKYKNIPVSLSGSIHCLRKRGLKFAAEIFDVAR